MGDGRRTMAPCGHIGEVIIGTYVQCTFCDAIPVMVERDDTDPVRCPRCPSCGSLDVEEFQTDIDGAIWYVQTQNIPSGPVMPPGAGEYHCWPCGKVFTL